VRVAWTKRGESKHEGLTQPVRQENRSLVSPSDNSVQRRISEEEMESTKGSTTKLPTEAATESATELQKTNETNATTDVTVEGRA